MIDPKSLRIGNTELNYKAMNNLEREIEAVIKSKMVKDRYGDFNLLEGGELESAARSLYHLVMVYTEKGFLAGRSQQSWKTFCKESGLTPTEPVVGSNGIINAEYKN